MLFNSLEFLLIFLPLVLLVFLGLQRLGNRQLLVAWLILASAFFYGWWNPVYLLLLGISALVNYNLGVVLCRHRGAPASTLLAVGISFNLGLLAYFKYANWFVDSIATALDTSFNFEHIVLPLAISFYTFQQITYLVDARRGLTQPHGFLEYCLFVTFFPQLIAGPIVHHSEMLSQFRQLDKAQDIRRNLTLGLSVLAIGLFKKVVIADGFALFATPVFELAADGQQLYRADAMAGLLAYALQLYFDFSGYSDMAIGLACLFGIRLPVNFYSPYRAVNSSEFWRRWHVTLSRFLRDYLYVTLGGNRRGTTRRYMNLMITMLLGGLWHGAAWTFVIWGALHGLFLCVHHAWRTLVSSLGLQSWFAAAPLRPLFILMTFMAWVLSMAFFRADSVDTAVQLLATLWQPGAGGFVPAYQAQLQLSNIVQVAAMLAPWLSSAWLVYGLVALALANCWLLPNTAQLFQAQQLVLEQPTVGRAPVLAIEWQPGRWWALFIALLGVASCLNLTSVSEFIYFQF